MLVKSRTEFLDRVQLSFKKGTGMPGVLQSMGLQRVGHDWATEQQQCLISYVGKLLGCGGSGWKTDTWVKSKG